MKNLRFLLAVAASLLSFSVAHAASLDPGVNFVNDLLSRMTTAEKAAQLVQVSAWDVSTGPGQPSEYEKMIARGEVGSVLNSYSLEKMIKLQKLAVESTRLRIPLLFAGDIIHGHRTKFPVPLAESSSWDLPRIEKSARLAAIEAASIGLDWTFAPMVDIARDPRWGRVVEGAGEDPWWGARVAAARVRGFQGKSLTDTDSLMACAKHFAGYGAAIAGRDYNSAELSEREMREVYLPPFRAAVDVGVSTLMAAFHDIAGIPSSANPWLLKKVLRKEWGFRGFVVSDYDSIKELINHGVAGDTEAAAKLAFQAGLDVDMEGGVYHQHLASLVDRNVVAEEALNASVRKILLAKYRRGLFSDPFRYMDEKRAEEAPMSEAHIEHSRDMARRSIVLLKNDGVLPLKPEGRIALIGPLAEIEFGMSPDETYKGVRKPSVSFLSAMQKASAGHFELQWARGARFSNYKKVIDNRPDAELLREALEAARGADVIVMAIGESPDQTGEAASRTKLRVPSNQRRLLKAVRALGKPVVTVLSNGRPLVIHTESRDSNALLETWYLGTMAGSAIVDVLFGDYNPSGKLPVTFPRNEGQIPIYYASRNTGRPASEEDSWTSKYLDSPNSPLFPFGWGLSYTTFKYSGLQVRPRSEKILDVSVTVTNTGKRAGEETVQLYIRDLVASVSRPVKQLRGFEKVFLQPGESRRVTLSLTEEDLRFYDTRMKWVSEPGRFWAMVGGNSVELLMAEFELVKSSRGLVFAPNAGSTILR